MRERSLPLEPITCAATVLRDELLFEGQQRLQAMRLGSVFAEANLLQPHLLNLFFEIAVLGPHSAQIEIVVPEIAGAVLRSRPARARKE